jgi:sortase (surface protein transpeptidase)
VFKSLPKIPGLLQNGGVVEIILTTREARYLYRVISTEVSKPRDVDLFRPTTEPSLTLITCVPDFVYSDRFLVNAILVGKAPLP